MDLYGKRGRAIPQKLAITAIELTLIAVSAWFMFGAGEAPVARLFGFAPAANAPARRFVILAFSLITLARFVLMMFRFMRRTIPWSEALAIPFAFAVYYLGFALIVLPAQGPFDGFDVLGIVLFVAGALFNTVAEWQRDAFKRRPENAGRLFTHGLFGLAIHINFFGDILWVAGYAAVAHSPWGALIPAALALFFAAYNAPMLDRHLAEHYGGAFGLYAARTKRLVPFVW